MRGIVIAGTHSGCGKTTVTLGILAALRRKGLTVQPFKAGPDFIDAGLHRLVADRPSRNLDQWMCSPDYVVDTFTRHSLNADVAVVEGVMGMYDGELSTASLAQLLDAPVILVVDAYGIAESAGAIVSGFAKFGAPSTRTFRGRLRSEFGVRSSENGMQKDNAESRLYNSELNFAGVIFNRVASENHFTRLKTSVHDVPVLGYLPRELDFEIPHRHLGLIVAEENPLAGERLDRLAEMILKHIDIDLILRNSEIEIPNADHSRTRGWEKSVGGNKGPRIAVAYDKAFTFYYEDNLDLLSDAGVEIIRFSPLTDPAIPHDVDAVYIGGGYPELYANALSRNTSMLESVGRWASAGKPLYAECGGLMYLSKGIRDFDNTFFAMAGVFPFETQMMKKPRLGYREIVLHEDCILGGKDGRCRGHEFHYSEIKNEMRGGLYGVMDSRGKALPDEGFRMKNTLASYIHVHFGSNVNIAKSFAAFMLDEARRLKPFDNLRASSAATPPLSIDSDFTGDLKR